MPGLDTHAESGSRYWGPQPVRLLLRDVYLSDSSKLCQGCMQGFNLLSRGFSPPG